MKTLILLVCLSISLFSSCEKSNDIIVDPTFYSQNQINGVWENVIKDSNGCINRLIITPSSLTDVKLCAGSSVARNYESYSFDGFQISGKYDGINVLYTVNNISAKKLFITLKLLGKMQSVEYNKVY